MKINKNHVVILYVVGFLSILCFKSFSALFETGLPLKDLIARYRFSSPNESITPIAKVLVKSTLLVAVEEEPEPDAKAIKFTVTTDQEGKLWACMYTDQEEFSSAFPKGGKVHEMWFPLALKTINQDNRFEGIIINDSFMYQYKIPRVMFDNILVELNAKPNAGPKVN